MKEIGLERSSPSLRGCILVNKISQNILFGDIIIAQTSLIQPEHVTIYIQLVHIYYPAGKCTCSLFVFIQLIYLYLVGTCFFQIVYIFQVANAFKEITDFVHTPICYSQADPVTGN